MTDGTFRTWEMVAGALGGVILLASLFIGDLAHKEPDFKWIVISGAVGAVGLFAKPVWLLGNWKEIRTWERTTAFIRQSYTTGRGRGIRYHLYLEFSSKEGKVYHKDIVCRTMFRRGDMNDIMFAKESIWTRLFSCRRHFDRRSCIRYWACCSRALRCCV